MNKTDYALSVLLAKRSIVDAMNEEEKDFGGQGVCPKCGGKDLDYMEVSFEGESLYFPWICRGCKTSGREWYSMEFVEQQAEVDA
jgi:hypothetical protein